MAAPTLSLLYLYSTQDKQVTNQNINLYLLKSKNIIVQGIPKFIMLTLK